MKGGEHDGGGSLHVATVEDQIEQRLQVGRDRYGPGFDALANAVGQTRLADDPELYARSLVGTWDSVDDLVDEFIDDVDLPGEVERLPNAIQPFVTIDRDRVAAHLQEELTVVVAGDRVWVFDVRHVVKTTVEQTQQ